MNGLIMCTNECNMRCKYCFEESIHRNMHLPITEIRNEFDFFINNYLGTFAEQLIEINKKQGKKKTNICFHGGEPLLIGKELFEKACSLLREYPNIEITIQTNATLLDEDYIELLRKYDVHVGISIDGYEELNDLNRVMMNGKGSFSVIENNIKLMKEKGVIVGALATVTSETVKHPEEFYNFFKKYNLDFSFNPLFIAPDQITECSGLTQADFISFYKKMFYIWINDKDSDISITCFDRIIKAMTLKKEVYMEVCTYIPDCSSTTVAIRTTGDFYRCLHYGMNKKNAIGNISVNDLSIAVGNAQFASRRSVLRETTCKDCDIFEYCYGGCPYVAESENGTIFGKDNTCLSQKAIVHEIYNYFSTLKK